MLFCCNNLFAVEVSKTLKSNNEFFKKVYFGKCPICGVSKYQEIKITKDNKRYKTLSGRLAEEKIRQVLAKEGKQKQGSKSNQNFYYGDFKKTNEKDLNGLPIYIQLRKNLNGQYEELGKIETKVLTEA